jgi:hypothetical protein
MLLEIFQSFFKFKVSVFFPESSELKDFQCCVFVNMVARHSKFLILTHSNYSKHVQNEKNRLTQET